VKTQLLLILSTTTPLHARSAFVSSHLSAALCLFVLQRAGPVVCCCEETFLRGLTNNDDESYTSYSF
jgi:hypothetical protein